MWPFRKKQILPRPDDVISGDNRAFYSTLLKGWDFEIDGIEFSLSGREFDIRAFEWARKEMETIGRLENEIDGHVLEVLDGYPFDIEARHLFAISLDDYLSEGQLNLSFVGDDSWADFGVNVIVANGRVVGAYGGD
jgi:hypothetical protein